MAEAKVRENWQALAGKLKSEVTALYFACRDPRVPIPAKILIAGVVGYALSPLDLIPDFIPVLGYLDDLVLIPLGVALAIKMIPAAAMADAREKAKTLTGKPVSRAGAAAIVTVWLALAALVINFLLRLHRAVP